MMTAAKTAMPDEGRPGQIKDHDESIPGSCDHRTALEILHYNQNLVQLADSKAGNLIIINSIFLASITSLVMESAQVVPGYAQVFSCSFFSASVAAIFFCLSLIMTKVDFSGQIRHTDLIFFGDIVHRKNSEGYIFEFIRMKPQTLLSDILRRIYATSAIASKKFSLIKTAQNLTLFASILWVVNIVLIFVK